MSQYNNPMYLQRDTMHPSSTCHHPLPLLILLLVPLSLARVPHNHVTRANGRVSHRPLSAPIGMKQPRFNRGSQQRFERLSVAAAAGSSRRGEIRNLLGLLLTVGTSAAPGGRSVAGEGPLDQEPVVSKFTKLPSGTQIADLSLGKGSEIQEGSRVLIDYVFRRADGYFVASTENGEPFGFTVGSTEAIPGLDEGIRGMKQGGTRRIVIPIKNRLPAAYARTCHFEENTYVVYVVNIV